jgi:hypothetical protein
VPVVGAHRPCPYKNRMALLYLLFIDFATVTQIWGCFSKIMDWLFYPKSNNLTKQAAIIG